MRVGHDSDGECSEDPRMILTGEREKAGEMVSELSLQTMRVQSRIEKEESPFAAYACREWEMLRLSTQGGILKGFD